MQQMIDIKVLVRKNVLNLTPYSCARDEYQGPEGIFMDANENPYGNLNRYPDPYQKELKKALAIRKNVPEENIFIGNGSDEIIDLCYRIFCNPGADKALIFPPTYGMYEVSASINDVHLLKVPLNEEFQIDLPNVQTVLCNPALKLVFICSPNNPTGNAMNFPDVKYILKTFSGIVIIDEAYIDFSDKQSFIRLVDKYNNLILMQTFSKALGLAAARVGFAFTNTEIIQLFNKMKPPYNVSTINQRAAIEKLARPEELKEQVDEIKSERQRLKSELMKIKIVEKIYPSDANFLLVKVSNADYLYNELVNRNIIVRNRNSIVRNCLRITVGKKDENDKLIQVLQNIETI
jgi:histidinol-phosphate aminotransferase